jgi:hypothetical protein
MNRERGTTAAKRKQSANGRPTTKAQVRPILSIFGECFGPSEQITLLHGLALPNLASHSLEDKFLISP